LEPLYLTEKSLESRIISASKWSFLTEIAARTTYPLIFLVLAWLLTPDDYGVATVAVIIIGFSQVFWEGLSKSLIQRQEDIERAADIIFWTNVTLGLILYAFLFLIAELVAELFKEPRLVAVIRVQGLQLILSSLGSVQTALFQRELNFRALFWVRLTGTSAPGIASIPLAWLGFGYWALVAGALFGALAQMLLLWTFNPWRPRLEFDVSIAKQLYSFGSWVAGEGFLIWLVFWMDSIIVGSYMGSHELGLYRTGMLFAILVFGFLLSPVLPVLFSSLSSMQHDSNQLHNTFRKATKLIAIVALPVGLAFFVGAETLSAALFSEKWQGIGQVIAVLGLMYGITWVVGANSEAYRAIGRADLHTKIMLASVIYSLPVLIWAAPHGLTTFLWARLAVECITILIHMIVAQIYLNFRITALVLSLKWILPASIMMGLVVGTVDKAMGNTNEWITLFVLVIIGVITFFSLLIPERKFLKQIILLLQRSFGNRM
jgi:PST family polysaccharide transporter